ncbi:hypothetical protein JD79_04152 [Geodermatophilus normandii]|uniref:Uncharacterized protein n=1 Tax=Geodermatophilus normandii TaxID=1137989 RepID=A0A317QMX8_9ACTN|nr:hypothetical protein JD79_04152 [Geodermatophilus normandii]
MIHTALTAAAVAVAVLAPLAIVVSAAVLTVAAGRGRAPHGRIRRSGRDVTRGGRGGRRHLRPCDEAVR